MGSSRDKNVENEGNLLLHLTQRIDKMQADILIKQRA